MLIHIILCICTLIFNTYRDIPANSQLTAFLCRSAAAFCLFSIRSIYFCMHIECVFKEAAYFTDLFSVSHLLSHIDFSHSLHMDWIFSLGHFFFPLCFSLSRCALFIHDFFFFYFFRRSFWLLSLHFSRSVSRDVGRCSSVFNSLAAHLTSYNVPCCYFYCGLSSVTTLAN